MRGAHRVSVVIPLRDKRDALPRALGSVLAAAGEDPGIEIIVVDNGSADGSADLARQMLGARGQLVHAPGLNVGAVRNRGAARSSAPILSFIDADCEVPLGYFSAVERILEREGVQAAGCWVDYPPGGPWVERVWHQLHFRTGEGFRTYVNAASFAVRREAFEAVGGFDQSLETGEDAEIGQRLNQRGHRIYETRELAVTHLDNPRTLRDFFLKEVWHGLGMFAGARRLSLDKPTAMMFAHGLLLVAAFLLLLTGGGWHQRALGTLACLAAVPLSSVAYRMLIGRRWVPILPAFVLYEVYYLARLVALGKILGARLWRLAGAARG